MDFELDASLYSLNADLEVFSGYDEQHHELHAKNTLQDWQEPGDVTFATKAQKIALATRMIALWTAYKDNAV